MTDKEYNITGTLTIDFDFNIEEYPDKEEALADAKEMIEDYLRLKYNGNPYFKPADVTLELDADEIHYEEEEE